LHYLLDHYLESAAALHPNNVAVIDAGRITTYAELDAASNQLANLLLAMGLERGDRVGIYMTKSTESLIAVYGILKAGGAYVPLDVQAPTARLGKICSHIGIRHLITGPDRSTSWPALMAEGAALEAVVVLAGDADGTQIPEGVAVYGPADVENQSVNRPKARTIAFDLAYVLSTSGSTGLPKGVMLSHQNAMAFVDWAAHEFRLTEEDRLSSHAPLHFDLSIFDVFAAAKVGAAVILVPPDKSFFPIDIAEFINENAITVWYSVPSILSMLSRNEWLEKERFPSLRTVLFAGEVFPTKHLRSLMGRLNHAEFYNLYGPTETNVCTYYKVPPLPEDETDPIPIGKSISNAEVFAVTDDGRLAAPGETGELFVRGATVMMGYWGDPEGTEQSLMPDPFGMSLGDRAYRTGDLVIQQPDGNFKFLGRRDHQIKSRGYRIELGEIEAALYAHPDVIECAAVAIPDDLLTNRIVAFAVVRNGLSGRELARFCSSRIPRYMVPESIEIGDALPKSSTGKIDREALNAVPTGLRK
jgi:amino acid adenylation domain-containing protein